MSSPTNPKPLDAFTRLASFVYLFSPATGKTVSSSRGRTGDPELVILCSWMDAAPRHITKYTSTYMQMYPNAQILLITSSLSTIMFRTHAAVRRELEPAVAVVRACSTGKANILLHLYSNGGSTVACHLAHAFREKEGKPLPIAAMALDSAPGKPHYWMSHRAMVLSLPKNRAVRFFGSFLIHMAILLFFFVERVFRVPNFISKLRRELVEKELFPVEAPRCYLYSEADAMVWYRDVDEHADAAREAGSQVSTVRFRDSAHAGHIMEDGTRYWSAIQDLWSERVRRTG